jgi:CHAD domain-containing protein
MEPEPANGALPPPAATGGDHRSATADEFARRAIVGHFEAMTARIDGIVAGQDPEAVHQFRVAARRLRAVARTFAALFPEVETQALLATVKELARLVGQARDLDVQVGYFTAYLASQPTHERRSLQTYLAELQAERQALQPTLAAVFRALQGSDFIERFRYHFGTLRVPMTLEEMEGLRRLRQAPP